MTDRELRRLSKFDLVQLLLTEVQKTVALTEQVEELQAVNERLKAKLDDKDETQLGLKSKLDDKDAQIEKLKQRLDSKDLKLDEYKNLLENQSGSAGDISCEDESETQG